MNFSINEYSASACAVMNIVLTSVGERPLDRLYDFLIVLRDAADGSYADLLPQLVPELVPSVDNFGGTITK